MMKKQRGIKKCPQCSCNTGVRTKLCKKCGHEFHFTPQFLKKQKGDDVDWTTLQKGDVIKVINGSGPYIIIDKEDECGNVVKTKESFGYSGTFRVNHLLPNAILAYPVKANESGMCCIYMGETTDGDIYLKVIKKAHKIKLIKNRR